MRASGTAPGTLTAADTNGKVFFECCVPDESSAGVLHDTQVLTNPSYMEDHLAVLDEDIAAGAVPLPQLPTHKQVRSIGVMAMRAWLGVVAGLGQAPSCAHVA